MRHNLVRYPDTPSATVSAIAVDIVRGPAGSLMLHYHVGGDPGRLTPPPGRIAMPRRADELWLHTCFEAFIKPDGGEGYLEFNIAPTHDWQAYAFSGYRAGRHPLVLPMPPLETAVTRDGCELRVDLPLAGLVTDGPWHIGLAAVIEESGGAISYWALKHAPDKPDFHHPDTFALTVSP